MAQYRLTVDGGVLQGLFLRDDGLVRLIAPVLVEIDKAWTSGRRYFHMADYREWRKWAVEKEVVAMFKKSA